MPLLPLSSSDEGFTAECIAAEEEEGRQSRLGIREEENNESRLGAEPEDWTYRSEDCLTYEDCLDNCLESPSQIQLQVKEKDCRLVPPARSERKEEGSAEFKEVKKQESDVSEHKPSEAPFRLPTSPAANQSSEDVKSDKHQQSLVQCSVVLVDKQIARRSPLNSAKPPSENFFLSSFRKAGENMAAANSLSAIGETVNKNKDSAKKREDSKQKEAEQINTQLEESRGKNKEHDVKVKKEDLKAKKEEEQKKNKEEEQKRLAARKSRDMNQSKAKEIIRKNGEEAPKGIKSRDPKTKSLTTDLLKDPEKSSAKLATSSKKLSSDKSLKKSISAPSVPLDPVTKRKSSSSSSVTTIASESLASRAKHSSQERLRKLKKTMTVTGREEVKPRPVTTPTSTPSKRVHRTSSCSSSSSTKSSKSGSLTISSSYSSKSGSLSLSSTPSPTSNAERLKDSKVAPNYSKRSAPKTPTQQLITMKDGDKKRQHSVSSPSGSTKKKTPLVLEDTGGKPAVQVSYSIFTW